MNLPKHIFLPFTALWLFACSGNSGTAEQGSQEQTAELASLNTAALDTATFAGGCFWCVEASFEQIKGVEAVVSGYAGGQMANPTYRQVSSGNTQHAEAVQVYYDPQQIDYETLLEIFFTAHDPTQLNRQGPDVGPQYRSAIFYHSPAQKQMAEQKMQELGQSGRFTKDIVTELNPYTRFYMAEEYHQDYEQKNPNDSYIRNVSRPKINKVRERFSTLLKE